jgi:hypothetical protein
VEIVKTMLVWCVQPIDRFSVYRLGGHGGTGKSAIAKTLCKALDSQPNTWVITFFVSKDDAERRDPFRILHTFAWQLASKDAVMYQHVLAAVRSRSDLKERTLKEQVKELLRIAIEVSVGVRSVILVLDALDECLPSHGVEGGSLIHDLAEVLVDLPVRMVVTSRMENSLERMFASLPRQVTQQLHEIEGTSVTSDVRHILSDGFARISRKHRISISPWPSSEDLEVLVVRTGRFLIFAATVLKFVESDRESPEYRLREILNNASIAGARSEFGRVDALYMNVLLMAARSDPTISQVDEMLSCRLRTLVGTLVLLQKPLSIPALSQLLDVDDDIIQADVRALSAILLLSEDDDSSGLDVVRIFHPSFRDFLLQRCNDPQFSTDIVRQHHSISMSCLRILNAKLKRDICKIKDPTIPHFELVSPTLAEKLQRCVPSAVQYACQFWIIHIANSGSPDASLWLALQAFNSKHILHWIEALSLIGSVPYVIKNFTDTIKWMQVSATILLNQFIS